MNVVSDAALEKEMTALRLRAGRIAFVPTMGNLHDGHLALVRQARAASAESECRHLFFEGGHV